MQRISDSLYKRVTTVFLSGASLPPTLKFNICMSNKLLYPKLCLLALLYIQYRWLQLNDVSQERDANSFPTRSSFLLLHRSSSSFFYGKAELQLFELSGEEEV